jgi:hypothetical protein
VAAAKVFLQSGLEVARYPDYLCQESSCVGCYFVLPAAVNLHIAQGFLQISLFHPHTVYSEAWLRTSIPPWALHLPLNLFRAHREYGKNIFLKEIKLYHLSTIRLLMNCE